MLLRAPRTRVDEDLRYRTTPRPKRSFHTVLDAKDLYPVEGITRLATTFRDAEPATLEVLLEQSVVGGRAQERCELLLGDHLRTRRLERRVLRTDGTPSREERVDFEVGPPRLPEAAYPDVMLPFLLRWQPFDRERRSLYAWIGDRFVAKVYYETVKRSEITILAGRRSVIEVVIYPDLNDWVRLGSLLTQLSKPFLPKYHMWYEAAEPHRLMRFEGPHGPPGAPELVLEWLGEG